VIYDKFIKVGLLLSIISGQIFTDIRAQGLTLTERIKVEYTVGEYIQHLTAFSNGQIEGKVLIEGLWETTSNQLYNDLPGSSGGMIELVSYLTQLQLKGGTVKIRFGPLPPREEIRYFTQTQSRNGERVQLRYAVVKVDKYVNDRLLDNCLVVNVGNYKVVNVYRELPARVSGLLQSGAEKGIGGEAPSAEERTNEKDKLLPEEKTTAPHALSEVIVEIEKDMVYVEGGSFTMGCTSEQSDCRDDEKPTHRVTLSSYYISKYEVTQSQWESVMGTAVSEQRDKVGSNWPLNGTGPNYPMYYVSWNEAQEFIWKLNAQTGGKYRLPTEAEWEYAARGGATSRSYQYSGSNKIGSVAWYNGKRAHPVGRKSANELGLFDMSGNVLEWCKDWYDEGYYANSPATNPQGPSSCENRVMRGGNFSFAAWGCRVALRHNASPGDRWITGGFRLACSQE